MSIVRLSDDRRDQSSAGDQPDAADEDGEDVLTLADERAAKPRVGRAHVEAIIATAAGAAWRIKG